MLNTLASLAPREVLASMKWNTPKASAFENLGGHAIAITGIRDGRVYIRNPWGTQAVGSEPTVGPRRRIEKEGGIESMTVEDFLKDFHMLYLPRALVPPQPVLSGY